MNEKGDSHLFLGGGSLARRAFLGRSAQGVGAVALASLARPGLLEAAPQRGVLESLSLPQQAKRVIWLTMAGGPSHLETFDHKPKLAELDGQPMPESMTKGQQLAQLQGAKLICFGPQHPFTKMGPNGTEICSLFPHIGSALGDICLIRSMTTEAINHDPAHMFMNTGSQIAGRPSMGAWVTYGLGSEAADLPGFVVLTSLGRGGQNQPIAARQWNSGFLPSKYQGVRFRPTGDPVPYLNNPEGVSREARRNLLDGIQELNKQHLADYGDPETETRISQYEMAFQMQMSVPGLLDFKDEPKSVMESYGPDVNTPGSFARHCLIARRLVERGTRFVQLMHSGWDQHSNLFTQLEKQCEDTDRPSAALVKDLKRLGLLDSTLVVWGGEFGRTPFGQGPAEKPNGRDHFGRAFSLWMAGGGVKAGHVVGATDDFAWNITKDPIHVHDHQATMLHLLGIDHEKLTFRYQGRQYRLTDVHGKVVKGILA